MNIDSIDHVVLTVKDLSATCEFYSKVLGMEIVTFGEGRKALSFGSQKINLQQLGRESTLVADKPTPGSADICFVASLSLCEYMTHLNSCEEKLIGGPVEQPFDACHHARIFFAGQLGHLNRRVAQLSGGYHLIEQADPFRLICFHYSPRVQQSFCLAHADK